MPSASEECTKGIFGLGNPGVQYRGTRHNCGFRVVDELARRWNVDFEDRGCRSLIARGGPAHLVKPQTYMNRSGFAARCLVEKWGYRAGEILVVFDDIDLPLGTLRLRASGSPGGHFRQLPSRARRGAARSHRGTAL